MTLKTVALLLAHFGNFRACFVVCVKSRCLYVSLYLFLAYSHCLCHPHSLFRFIDEMKVNAIVVAFFGLTKCKQLKLKCARNYRALRHEINYLFTEMYDKLVRHMKKKPKFAVLIQGQVHTKTYSTLYITYNSSSSSSSSNNNNNNNNNGKKYTKQTAKAQLQK